MVTSRAHAPARHRNRPPTTHPKTTIQSPQLMAPLHQHPIGDMGLPNTSGGRQMDHAAVLCSAPARPLACRHGRKSCSMAEARFLVPVGPFSMICTENVDLGSRPGMPPIATATGSKGSRPSTTRAGASAQGLAIRPFRNGQRSVQPLARYGPRRPKCDPRTGCPRNHRRRFAGAVLAPHKAAQLEFTDVGLTVSLAVKADVKLARQHGEHLHSIPACRRSGC